MRLLLIADSTLAKELKPCLQRDGVTLDPVDSVERADAKFATRNYEAVLVDSRFARGTCPACLTRWRREGVAAHLLVVLPRASTAGDRAACLDAGADNCLTHPLWAEELAAFLRALRRRDTHQMSPVRRVHDLEIDSAVRSVRRAGRSIHLTPREFDLLNLLASNPGKVLTRSMILEHLYDDKENLYSNVVDIYIRYLRSKIDKGHETPLILTRWGEGYLLRAEGV
jgi:DNA-binding response OmpR family regulator